MNQGKMILGITQVKLGLQMRKLLNAGASPGRTEIKQYHFPPLLIEVPAVAVSITAGEIRGCLTYGIFSL